MEFSDQPDFDFEGYDALEKRERVPNIGIKVVHVEDVLDMEEPKIEEMEKDIKQLLQDVKDINARHGLKP